MTAIPKQTSAIIAAQHFADGLREANPAIRSLVTVESNGDSVNVVLALPQNVDLNSLSYPVFPDQVSAMIGKTNPLTKCFYLTFLLTDDTSREHSTGNY